MSAEVLFPHDPIAIVSMIGNAPGFGEAIFNDGI